MKTTIVAFWIAVSLSLVSSSARAGQDDFDRVTAANDVLREILSEPDEGIPQELLDHAHCVVVVPGLKRAGFVLGGRYGVGVASCRRPIGGWSAPSTMKMEGGSIGFQIGAGETDLVLVVMNERGKDRLYESKFTLGGEAAAMAGPVGRQSSAETDAYLSAEILSYSKSRGLFAGVNIKGSTLRPDDEANRDLYGKAVSHRGILEGQVAVPAAAQPLLETLNKFSPYEAGKVSRR